MKVVRAVGDRGAVAFDLDGCLIDSRPAILPSVRAALVSEGLPALPDGEILWLIGPPLLTGFAELLARLGGDPAAAPRLLDAYRADYRETMFERTTAFPGMPEALAAVAATRPVCVVTSKPAPLAAALVDHLGLGSLLAFVEGPALDAGHEPKGVTLGRAMASLDISVMVGDRHHDVDAGRQHGLRTVGVTWGIGSPDEF
ncbi:MAG: HAD hydrolase-like protein, partial [Acidimicrobiia bacterium]